MSYHQILHTIKSTVNSFLPESKVLLFGSRARGDGDQESDYDLLIVTTDTFAPRVKMNWENKIRKALVYSLKAPFDVILESENEVNEKKGLTGHIIYYAMKEAVEI
jgi:predicted nucleotidyltransferase